MTKTIEQLQANVAELEEENARLNGVIESNIDDGIDKIMAMSDEQISALAGFEGSNPQDKATIARQCMDIAMLRFDLAASQAYAKQLREALVVLSKVSSIGCGRVYEALALPHSTSALDAYVSEKVKEIIESHAPEGRNVTNAQHVEMRHKFVEQIATLTQQRDLAVSALEAIAGRRIFIDNLASNVDIAVMTLDTIKESEAK